MRIKGYGIFSKKGILQKDVGNTDLLVYRYKKDASSESYPDKDEVVKKIIITDDKEAKGRRGWALVNSKGKIELSWIGHYLVFTTKAHAERHKFDDTSVLRVTIVEV